MNGHSVVGMMIYQGDNWPASYRDRAYLLSLFGHRTNVETLERSGSGFVARRAPEPDIFDMPDPWYRGIDISYGPDGGVFISDWTDTGDYHNRTGENRLSGRIYKITYGDARASSGSDMTRLSVEQLVALNTHANEWFPRQARVEFSNRLVDGRGVGNAKQLLREQFNRESDVTRKLRALWTLYTIGGTDEAFLLPLLKSSDEHLRVWGIRILSEHWPIDALLTRDEAAPGATRIWTQQRPAAAVGGTEVTVSPAVIAELTRMAATDPSSLVRLVLASTMQRMPFSQRLAVASGLVTHKEDATDKNIPLMVWYALIPIAETNPSALASIAAKSELRATSKYVAAAARRGHHDPSGSRRHAGGRRRDPLRGIPGRHRRWPHPGSAGATRCAEAGRVGRVREERRRVIGRGTWSRRCGRWIRRSVAPGHSRRPAGSPSTTRRPHRLAGRRCSLCSTRARLTCVRSRSSCSR